MSETVWDSVGHPGTLGGNLWDCMGLSGTLRDSLGLSRIVWDYQRLSGTF